MPRVVTKLSFQPVCLSRHRLAPLKSSDWESCLSRAALNLADHDQVDGMRSWNLAVGLSYLLIDKFGRRLKRTYESSLPERGPPRRREGERGRRGGWPHRRRQRRAALLLLLLLQERRGRRGHLEVAHRPHGADLTVASYSRISSTWYWRGNSTGWPICFGKDLC